MDFKDYQQKALSTMVAGYSIYKMNSKDVLPALKIAYLSLGAAGEAGEIAEQCKKLIRDDYGKVTLERVQKIKKEIGDTLWYLAVLCDVLGLDFNDVAMSNIDKLKSRNERGVVRGEGNDR